MPCQTTRFVQMCLQAPGAMSLKLTVMGTMPVHSTTGMSIAKYRGNFQANFKLRYLVSI